MSAANRVFFSECAGFVTIPAARPFLAEEGAFVPFAYRTTVLANDFVFGSVHVNVTLLVVTEVCLSFAGAASAFASAEFQMNSIER